MHDIKTRLSALWLFAMLNYTYGDIVTLMDPVKHGSLQLTEGFLLGASVFMEIPIAMILLSLVLKPGINRGLNVLAGAFMTLALLATLFVAVPTKYYVFWTVIEVVTTAAITAYAWKWKSAEAR